LTLLSNQQRLEIFFIDERKLSFFKDRTRLGKDRTRLGHWKIGHSNIRMKEIDR
jgi:hypothetical protein